jgi:hypothetical protein
MGSPCRHWFACNTHPPADPAVASLDLPSPGHDTSSTTLTSAVAMLQVGARVGGERPHSWAAARLPRAAHSGARRPPLRRRDPSSPLLKIAPHPGRTPGISGAGPCAGPLCTLSRIIIPDRRFHITCPLRKASHAQTAHQPRPPCIFLTRPPPRTPHLAPRRRTTPGRCRSCARSRRRWWRRAARPSTAPPSRRASTPTPSSGGQGPPGGAGGEHHRAAALGSHARTPLRPSHLACILRCLHSWERPQTAARSAAPPPLRAHPTHPLTL